MLHSKDKKAWHGSSKLSLKTSKYHMKSSSTAQIGDVMMEEKGADMSRFTDRSNHFFFWFAGEKRIYNNAWY
jgi:hypothetical protein